MPANRARLILLGTTIVSFMVPFDGSVVNLALPSIGTSLNAQLSSLVWIPTAYLLVNAAFQAPMGRLGDILGRKKVISFGIALFTIGSVLAALSPNVLILIANRIMQGIGGATMGSGAIAIVADTFHGDRGKALGINTSAVYSGQSFGPIIGAVLVQFAGWRSIFLVNLPIGIISLLLILLYVPKEIGKHETGKRFDIPGSVLFSLFLTTLMLSLSQTELSLSQFETVIFALGSLVSVVSFIVVENRYAKDPVIDLKLFSHNRPFAAGNLTTIFNYTTNQGTLLVISLYLQLVHGYSPIGAALFLVAQPVVQAFTSIVSGSLSDRVDARILTSVGVGIRALGLFGLSFLTLASPPSSIWIPMAIIGLGHGLFSPPNTNSIISSVPGNKRGIASGIMGTVRTASSSTGIVVMTAIIAGAMPAGAFASVTGGTEAITGVLAQTFVTGMHYTFLFAATFSAIGILTSLVRGKSALVDSRSEKLASDQPNLEGKDA